MGELFLKELEHLFEQAAALIDAQPPRGGPPHQPPSADTSAKRTSPADLPPARQCPEAHQSRDDVRLLHVCRQDPVPEVGDGVFAEAPVRPMLRPAVPVLKVLDDGSLDDGEEIRIRREVFTIGRNAGDLVLPHDPTLSSQHAELRRTIHRGLPRWTLRDTGSMNCTYVRVTNARLYPDSIVILGTQRYRLRKAAGAALGFPAGATGLAAATCHMAIDHPPAAVDALVDVGRDAGGLLLELRGPRIKLGRDPRLCPLHVDDAALAAVHAELRAEPDGGWRIIAAPSRNGVWVSMRATRLPSGCYFQCGEQRFRFVLP